MTDIKHKCQYAEKYNNILKYKIINNTILLNIKCNINFFVVVVIKQMMAIFNLVDKLKYNTTMKYEIIKYCII